jgi:hypothetical protein
VVVAAAVFFWLGSKKKTKSTDNKGESKSSEWGKKNEKRKIWGSDLGPVRKSD